MNGHSTLFEALPFYANLHSFAEHYLKRERWEAMFPTQFTISHVMVSLFILIMLIMGALIYRSRISATNKERLIPEAKLGNRNFFELITDATLGIAEGVMGRHKAERFLPLIGTLVFFILLNNLIGLVPGFMPATQVLKTNVALSLTVFVLTHVFGVMAHGLSYFKHFAGPIWWLAWLMIPIELISHCVRPVSLALRLAGNMTADHKVVAAFFMLVPILVPLPFLILGTLVCIVQTLVFSLLSIVYIDMAVAHEDH